jgi:hypothetical protein
MNFVEEKIILLSKYESIYAIIIISIVYDVIKTSKIVVHAYFVLVIL